MDRERPRDPNYAESLKNKRLNALVALAAIFGIGVTVYALGGLQSDYAYANDGTPVPLATQPPFRTPPPTVTGSENTTPVATHSVPTAVPTQASTQVPKTETPVPLQTVIVTGTLPPTVTGSNNPTAVATHEVPTSTPFPTEIPTALPTATPPMFFMTPTPILELTKVICINGSFITVPISFPDSGQNCFPTQVPVSLPPLIVNLEQSQQQSQEVIVNQIAPTTNVVPPKQETPSNVPARVNAPVVPGQIGAYGSGGYLGHDRDWWGFMGAGVVLAGLGAGSFKVGAFGARKILGSEMPGPIAAVSPNRRERRNKGGIMKDGNLVTPRVLSKKELRELDRRFGRR